jgi:hypothetical protein
MATIWAMGRKYSKQEPAKRRTESIENPAVSDWQSGDIGGTDKGSVLGVRRGTAEGGDLLGHDVAAAWVILFQYK